MTGCIMGVVVGGLAYYGLDRAGCVGLFSGAVALGIFIQCAVLDLLTGE